MPTAIDMSLDQLRSAMGRLESCIASVDAYSEPLAFGPGPDDPFAKLVNDTLADIFGTETDEYARAAARFRIVLRDEGRREEYGTTLRRGKKNVRALLEAELERLRVLLAHSAEPGDEQSKVVELSARGSVTVSGRAAPNVERILAQPPFVRNDTLDVANSIAADAARRRQGLGVYSSAGPIPAPLQAEAAVGVVAGLTADATVIRGLPSDWARDRPAMLERIGQIEGALKRIAPVIADLEARQVGHGEIGHNQPPEPLPIDTAEIQRGISAANVVRIEISEERPNFEAVRLSWLVFKQLAKGIGKLVTWLGGVGNKFCDAAATSTGKAVGPVIAGIGITVILAVLHDAGVDLAYVTDHVEQLLRAVAVMH